MQVNDLHPCVKCHSSTGAFTHFASKIQSFLIFSGGIKREHWEEMGYTCSKLATEKVAQGVKSV